MFLKITAITARTFFNIFNGWVGVSSPPKKFKKFKIGKCSHNEKYIPTTKYVTITAPQKAFLSPYFLNLCTDTAEYCSIKPLLVNCCYNTLQVKFFCCLWTLNVFNNSFSLANKQRRNYVKNLTKTI